MSGELPDSDCAEPVEEVTPLPPATHQETITEVLQRDILSAEFLLALFWSAMNSFRHDSILRPFPSMFLESVGAEAGMRSERSEREEQKKDIEGLVRNCLLCDIMRWEEGQPIRPGTQYFEKGGSTCAHHTE